MSNLKNTPATKGIIVMLYANAQTKFIRIKVLALFINLIKARILYKFSDRMTTSAALMFNSDLALILTPMAASCKQGISLSPK